ncbi:N-acetylated-alpha-linked acidic dipeptidase 2-like [Haliotis rufescens]|uniref:N-acetylated-alpha-linked acidic dipeptidase 2-like n=1 Tax=Haliotis rufescens TaxID=6454 RepID=UPI00201EDE69|nr:N-acetylated-alpha-linked acidic dipeptidase 2-like [Haliotis rufescens]
MQAVGRRWVLLAAVAGVVAFVSGLLIGLYAPATTATEHGPESDGMLLKLVRAADAGVSERLIRDIDPANIDRHLRKLTERPHLAGMPGNFRTAEYVRDQWLEQGYDVHMVPYNVLLSYPDDNHNNTASLIASDSSVLFQSTPREIAFYDEETHPEAVQPYNAFSPSGQPEAELVYANYARDVDFENLTRQGLNVSGKIVIARYGRIFRGNKVNFAHQYGAVGIILFMDPGDYAKGDNFYPESMWLPPTGVQRGNIVMIKGDQATPGYPATWYTARLNDEELKMKLPQIPCHPIGYSDAYMLLREMEGDTAPPDWQGGLNITYRLGGTMKDGKKVKLDVQNHLQTVTIYNVFAKMKGTIENDRVVLIGNHRDAWVYGGTDPSSGSATVLEMSRVYAKHVQDGWEPRRSVIFCSWDAEEFGLVGSYEWVEENVKWLAHQAVAYLNIDLTTSGNYTINVAATPTLKQAVYRAARKVPDPHQDGRSLFEVWRERSPDTQNADYPSVGLPGAGSDFVPFEQDVAIPTASSSYRDVDLGDRIHRAGYPLYHTLYDGYRYVKMMDPQLKASAAVAAIFIELARDLVDSLIIPMDVRDYASAVDGFVKGLVENQRDSFAQRNISSDAIQSAADNFTKAANDFNTRLGDVDIKNPIAVRGVNDKLMALEKAFQVHTGLPSRKEYKHVLLSPSSANYYKTTTFPGLADLLYQIGHNATRWREVKIHLSVLTFTIQSAAHILMS